MPNKKKKGFGQRLNDTATSNPPQHNRQTKRKQWTDRQMQEAINEVIIIIIINNGQTYIQLSIYI